MRVFLRAFQNFTKHAPYTLSISQQQTYIRSWSNRNVKENQMLAVSAGTCC